MTAKTWSSIKQKEVGVDCQQSTSKREALTVMFGHGDMGAVILAKHTASGYSHEEVWITL